MGPLLKYRNDETYASTDLSRGYDKRQVGNTYTAKVRINQKYNIIGFISSGTYGRVYKAVEKNPKGDTSSPVATSPSKELYAIKKYVLIRLRLR
jgi:hypothetical protein